MGNLVGERMDIQNLLSYGDDLIGVLNNKKDSDNLVQSVEGAIMLHSSCRAEVGEARNSMQDLQEKISRCKENIDKSKSETTADEEIENLQKELEEKLQMERSLRQELSIVEVELDGLEHQRISIEGRKELVKKAKKDLLKAQNLLSMYASVTNIIPNQDGTDMISGFVTDRTKKKAKKFELETSMPPFEACNELWKLAQL